MAIHEKYFPGSSVSRYLSPDEHSWETVVYQSGKPVLDPELTLNQDIREYAQSLFGAVTTPSGWFRGQHFKDGYEDFFYQVPTDSNFVANGFRMFARGASVGGMPITVEFANTTDRTENLIQLDPPRLYDGTPQSFSRTDFAFLEVWRAQVAPSPRAALDITVDSSGGAVSDGDTVSLTIPVNIGGTGLAHILTARVGAPAANEFQIGGSDIITATNLAGAINTYVAGAVANNYNTNICTAKCNMPGAAGNAAQGICVAANPGALTPAILTNFTGGADMGNKPSVHPVTGDPIQDKIYRHGNVQSNVAGGPFAITNVQIGVPAAGYLTITCGGGHNMFVSGTAFIQGHPDSAVNGEHDVISVSGNDFVVADLGAVVPGAGGNAYSMTLLDDDLVDPVIDAESTQRVQIQYRIRVTGQLEGVNYKKHPDGFSDTVNIIYAQGTQGAPVTDYPFVPADSTSIWSNSSAQAYGRPDHGLWVAGDGSAASATALGTVDGFVYAIPLSFVYRHNDAVDTTGPGPYSGGFDSQNNANGAPLYNHPNYTSVDILGLIPAGVSDRPDGHFADVIYDVQLMDLRRSIAPMGQDLKAELQYQMQSLMDGNYRTWQVDTESKQDLGGTGDVSTQFLICNEIGRESGKGDTPPVISGDTPRGVTIRSFDHCARRFGAQSVVERFVVGFYPGDRDSLPAFGSGQANAGKYVIKDGGSSTQTQWTTGDELHLDFSNFPASSEGGILSGGPWADSTGGAVANPSVDFWSPGVVVTDVLSMWHDDGHFTTPINQAVQATTIVGLGTPHVAITLDTNPQTASGGLDPALPSPEYQLVEDSGTPADSSPRRIFVEVEVSYPIGAGLTDTPDYQVVPDASVGTPYNYGPVIENTGTALRPTDMGQPVPLPAPAEGLEPPRFREGFREVLMEYVAGEGDDNGSGSSGTAPIGTVVPEDIVSRTDTDLYFPRRVYRSGAHNLTVTELGSGGAVAHAVNDALSEYGSSSRLVSIGGDPLPAQQSLCQITYWAQDPLPNFSPDGYQISVYYRSNAPQTAGVKEGNMLQPDGTLPGELTVEPLLMAEGLWTGQVGMGSVDTAFPFVAPMDQVAVNDADYGNPSTHGEWYFAATAQISIDDFDAETGLLNLHTFVPGVRTTDLTLGGVNNPELPRKDVEFRAFYPFADDEAYRPTIMSQPVSGAVRHKVFMPMLARATEDAKGSANGLLWRKNELLLVVFSRFAELDAENTIRFVDTDNRTAAAVYRTKNLLIVVGD